MNKSAQVNKALHARQCFAVYPGVFVAEAFGYGLRMAGLSQLFQCFDLGFERRFVQPVECKQQIGQQELFLGALLYSGKRQQLFQHLHEIFVAVDFDFIEPFVSHESG